MDIETMKYYYQTGLWDIKRLDKLLTNGKITQLEYDEITTVNEDEGEVT